MAAHHLASRFGDNDALRRAARERSDVRFVLDHCARKPQPSGGGTQRASEAEIACFLRDAFRETPMLPRDGAIAAAKTYAYLHFPCLAGRVRYEAIADVVIEDDAAAAAASVRMVAQLTAQRGQPPNTPHLAMPTHSYAVAVFEPPKTTTAQSANSEPSIQSQVNQVTSEGTTMMQSADIDKAKKSDGPGLAKTKGADPKKQTLKINDIRRDRDLQVRVLNEPTVVHYAAEMGDGVEFPLPVVFYDGAVYWLVDGYHRVAACGRIGKKEVECTVQPGTKTEAQWASLAANKEYDTVGLRRTNLDKRKAVETALKHPQSTGLSNRVIADHVGVSPGLVDKLKPELPTVGNSTPAKNTGLDGKQYPAKKSKGEKKPAKDAGKSTPPKESESKSAPSKEPEGKANDQPAPIVTIAAPSPDKVVEPAAPKTQPATELSASERAELTTATDDLHMLLDAQRDGARWKKLGRAAFVEAIEKWIAESKKEGAK
jgi:ParB-like nuclease domain